MVLPDSKIIEIRQKTRTSDTTPWADTLAFAKALIAEYERQRAAAERYDKFDEVT